MLTPAKRDRAILLIHCGVVSEKYRAELRELAEKVCSDGRFAVVVAQNRDEQFRLATPLAPRPASDPLDPRGAPGSGHALGDEADSARGSQGEGEDPACGMVLLTPPRRRPDLEPTLSIFPDQLHVGDRFTDADTEGAANEWEVASRPVTFKQGHEVRARVQRLDNTENAC